MFSCPKATISNIVSYLHQTSLDDVNIHNFKYSMLVVKFDMYFSLLNSLRKLILHSISGSTDIIEFSKASISWVSLKSLFDNNIVHIMVVV